MSNSSSIKFDKKVLLSQCNDNNVKVHDRISFIKLLLNETGIKPILDIDDGVGYTEYFQSNVNKEIYNFSEIIQKIGGKLKYIKSGSTGHTFQGIYYPDPSSNKKTISYAVKVVAYSNEDETDSDILDSTRPENVELQILKILSQFVITNQTPHVVLPLTTFNTYIEPFICLKNNGFIKNKRYDAFVNLYEKKRIHNTVSILISEWANGGDLLEYLRKNLKNMTSKEWRVLLFQIVSVFAIIQKKYPAFRHNDAKANNWLIQNIDVTNDDKQIHMFRYTINDIEFFAPNIGYQIKLWDFDFACIQGIAENSKVNSEYFNNMNISNRQNRYYDLCFFLSSLQKPGFLQDFRESPHVPKDVYDFFDSIVPPELMSSKLINDRGRLLCDIEYTTPAEILATHPFFNKLRRADNRLSENNFRPIGREQLEKILKQATSKDQPEKISSFK
jgi:hypothetical protein